MTDSLSNTMAEIAAIVGPKPFANTRWVQVSSGFTLETGALKLDITDQRDRDCGWCWHVSADHQYGADTLAQGGHLGTANDAKRAAVAWARTFCETTFVAIHAAEAAS
jgi:hypothetical protein